MNVYQTNFISRQDTPYRLKTRPILVILIFTIFNKPGQTEYAVVTVNVHVIITTMKMYGIYESISIEKWCIRHLDKYMFFINLTYLLDWMSASKACLEMK